MNLHTHSPASRDTPEMNLVTPRTGLLAFMKEEIYILALTDHNTGSWIDLLRTEYGRMKENRNWGYRGLILLPGVEITTAEHVHLLALFPPWVSSRIMYLLDAIGSPSEGRGDASSPEELGLPEICFVTGSMGGIPIPAHIDRKRGSGLYS